MKKATLSIGTQTGTYSFPIDDWNISCKKDQAPAFQVTTLTFDLTTKPKMWYNLRRWLAMKLLPERILWL